MSLINHLFDSEWRQRSDIESLKSQVANAHSRVAMARVGEANAAEQIEELNTRVGKLNLVVEALFRTMTQQGLIKPNEFTEMLRAIDLEDGELDGQRNEPRPNVPEWCPDCEAKINPAKTYCMFCGLRFEDADSN